MPASGTKRLLKEQLRIPNCASTQRAAQGPQMQKVHFAVPGILCVVRGPETTEDAVRWRSG